MQVAVAGGTGLVGKFVVAELRAAGHQPVTLARSQGVDLTTGDGLQDRLSGCDVVINVANVVTTRAKVAVDFFSRTTGNLLSVARRTGIRHVITLSIVGSDEVDFGYYWENARRRNWSATEICHGQCSVPPSSSSSLSRCWTTGHRWS
jgi:nucleoside-diphosphate-sugar epimerase